MKTSQPLRLRVCVVALACLLSVGLAAAQSSPSIANRVTQVPDSSVRVTLKGNVHPLARAESDHGPAPSDLRLDRMLMVLKRSGEQELALTKLLDEQQDIHSPRFRQWLTPEQLGLQYLVADFTIEDRGITSQTITAGQTAQYISDIGVTPFFGFSGNVALSGGVAARDAVCSITPASLTPSGGFNIATVSVRTQVRSAAAYGRPRIPAGKGFGWVTGLDSALLILYIYFAAGSLTLQQRRLASGLTVAALLISSGALAAGCGGGGEGTGATTPHLHQRHSLELCLELIR